MIVQMVKVTNLKEGYVWEFSKKRWLKEVKNEPRLTNFFKVESFTKEIKSFKFIAWVHPIKGGDDYQMEVDQLAESLDEAKASIQQWLKKISIVTDDFEVVS